MQITDDIDATTKFNFFFMSFKRQYFHNVVTLTAQLKEMEWDELIVIKNKSAN